MSGSPIPKKFLILALALPVAALLGYMLAGPLDYTSIAVYSIVVGLILMPIVIQYHHAILILTLNAAVDVFFLPGKPHLWMLVTMASLGVTLVNRILNKEIKLVHVPVMTWTLVGMVVVVAVTAKLTGGLGMRALGDTSYGGKRYVFLIFALLVYLAVSCHRVPVQKARLYLGLYFLSTLTSVASNLIYMAGPGLWWLYLFFPVDYALGQAYEDFAIGATGVKFGRLSGFAPAAQAAFCFLLAQSGIRGLLDFSKPWRALTLVITVLLGMASGFRSGLIFIGLILVVQFILEGLVRTRLFLGCVLAGVLAMVALIPTVSKLPLSVQRSLSFLPLDVEPAVHADAQASTEWRLRMWEVLVPQIPRYLWLGKGYSTSETDFYLASESTKRGLMRDYELSLLAGDYHNGPLSVILPFGIWGGIAFLAFLVAALRVLYCNYRHGIPELKSINTLLLAYCISKIIFFFGVFGQLHTDLGTLAALVGLSVSLNGGMARPQVSKPVRAPAPAAPAAGRWRPVRA